MRPEEVPQELLDVLDARAGRKHDRSDPAVVTLAEILTVWDAYRGPVPCGRCRWGPRMIQIGHKCWTHDDCWDR